MSQLRYMNPIKTISLEEFRQAVEELAAETKNEFPKLYFDYAGIIPVLSQSFRYSSSPTNTEDFAATGGDGVRYSILELTENIQPVIMNVPMNFGDSMKDYNWIIAENLNEFLSLGFYNGWFPIEELCYNFESAIEFYSKENMEAQYQTGVDIRFVRKLRDKFGVKHIPLSKQRLKEMEDTYFGYLQFDPEFIEKYVKKRQ